MSFGLTPRDAQGVPVSSTYVPGTGFVALQGASPTTDGSGNQSAPLVALDVEQSGYVALTTPPTQTNAGTETVLTFSSQVNRVEIYNGSTGSLNYAFDETCTAGSLVLPASFQLDKTKQVTDLHLLTSAAVNINGVTAGNIVVKGSL